MASPRLRGTAVLLTLSLGVITVGCSDAFGTSDSSDTAGSDSSAQAASGDGSAAPAVWDSSEVHSFSVTYDEDEYDAMIQTYIDTEEKEWISATVTIDGVTYENVGLKLKGNSSLRGLSTDEDAELSSTNPETLPWVINLDEFVDGQSHEGAEEFVVRSNSSETALNEAVALELLAAAGLADEEAIAARFSANGSEEVLRLVIENPNTDWMERELGDGMLYKAEAGGDYSYRGDDPESYADVFDQEGGTDDLTPLIDFLEFINESSDEEFAADLDEHLDVDAFATYLAYQDLVSNTDDIDGPGNNSYLYYDPETGLMTVVNWDLNLAFGGSIGGGGGFRGGPGGGGQVPEGFEEGEMPEGMPTDLPDDAEMPEGGFPGGGEGGRGGFGNSNILSERFLENDEFQAMYDEAYESLQAELFDSGRAEETLAEWTQTLTDQASDLVDSDTITSESEALAAAFPS